MCSGYHFNVKTVAASLRRQELSAKASRKFSPISYRAHGLPVSENLLTQDFYASGPNQKWAGDITYYYSSPTAGKHGAPGY
ncbi:transposase [Shigella sp. FC1544]|nr:transposase [Shigella sp. FC1544]ODQ14095.1 transposase [Shigella sp. FC1056]OEG42320.1 transposase [Shigella sp. FC2531]OEG42830.1 transposase [Shigella sp. FC2541]OEG51588.1 transposase [Shigella sp. FC3196]OEI98327.1 transposase [Shigella sp. FC1708]OEJ01035.1 transposase [Shigella sp. FC1737]